MQPEFTLGRALTCTFPMTKDIIKENIIKNVSKQQFVIKRDLRFVNEIIYILKIYRHIYFYIEQSADVCT